MTAPAMRKGTGPLASRDDGPDEQEPGGDHQHLLLAEALPEAERPPSSWVVPYPASSKKLAEMSQ